MFETVPDLFLQLDTSYFFDSEKIIITASAEYFDPIKVLKLLEYGINNIKELIDNQIKFKYNFVYSNQYFWIQSLDSIKINKILSMENSEFINQLVNQQTKVIHYLLPNEYPDDKNIYYCYQNNKRYIYSKNRYYSNLPDTLLMILPNIKIFKIISCD